MSHDRSTLVHLARWLLLVALVVSVPAPPSRAADVAAPSAPPSSAQATTTTIGLRVVSARTEPRALDGAGVTRGDPVTEYQFIINLDNTGDPLQPRYPDCAPWMDAEHTVPNPDYPANCEWPSVRSQPGASPIVTQGDHTILNESTGIDLPPGDYLISVLAPGFKLDGTWFSVPMEEPGIVEVQAQPLPLPTATLRTRVFEDRMVNGQFDAPLEQGLPGFRAVIADIAGEITVDAFGNPLCTEYERDPNTGELLYDEEGAPIPVPDTGGECVSDENGDIVIPHVSPNRYEFFVVPPEGEAWIQTTTLEGGLGWDTWLQEAGTGLDNEFVVAAEPFPWAMHGFVRPMNELTDTSVTGGIRGTIVAATVYVPMSGGLPYYGDTWGGLSGAKVTGPVPRPWIALNDLLGGDTAVYIGQGAEDGSFQIDHVPDGDYSLTYWDSRNLRYLLEFVQVSVVDGQMVDIGTPFMTGWFSRIEGHVFVDDNGNGKRDPDEQGVPDFPLVLRRRDNAEVDRFDITTSTDPTGYYLFERVYPFTSWVVLEAYSDLYHTTGVTYQVENQPEPTTLLGDGVDIGMLPIIGQSARVDWGVQPYGEDENGGIAGTVFYDTTRNELDARFAAVEPFEPGIPGLTLNLYEAAKDPEGNFLFEPDGSYQKGRLLNTTTTETWERPTDCVARDVEGNPVDQDVLPPATGGHECLEGPVMGMQLQNGFATVNGNYGFTSVAFDTNGDPIPEDAQPRLEPGDYLVEVVIPDDAYARPLYQVTREEDVNVFGGDQYVPQIPPPACAGPLHMVDVAGVGEDGPDAVVNLEFAAEGGSPFEGMEKRLCNVKLVELGDGRSVAPSFNLFTPVPLPGRWRGYIIDDLTLSTNPMDLYFGEKAGVPNSPIGIYDFSMRRVRTILSDPHGGFEVLLPSTSTRNYPSPTGVAPNLYYILGNDPGQPGALNPTYNPAYRTIGTSFEVWPGVTDPADLAPTQIGVSIQGPGSQFNLPASCALDVATPQLYAVSQPYVHRNTGGAITIQGLGFGDAQGSGKVSLGSTALPIVSWSDRTIEVTVPAGMRADVYPLRITADNGQSLVNGLSFHVLGPGYAPALFEVGPGREYATIQSAIDAAAQENRALVVVFPGETGQWNPNGVYYENPVIPTPLKLQGVGPGGVYSEGGNVLGSVIDGVGMTGDTDYSEWWRDELIPSLDWDGNQNMVEGQVITILAQANRFGANYSAAIDGFTIQGGDQQGFPNNRQQIGGALIPGAQADVQVQGGGIYVNGHAHYLEITNNVLRSNGGAYGGAIRLGTPHWGDSENTNIRIASNQIIANGGTNLAGGIGIFDGSDNYEVANNLICGNFSAEYGGGISHYGYSPNGRIHHNRVYFNRSYDEGGGIMIAGELPTDPAILSPGAGPVSIYANIIQSNLANDDGGGLRFLMAGNYTYNVYNNIIANNVSTHEGGGISLNDAPRVRVYNNTIVHNITTATAMTSNGQPAPAGLSTTLNSALLQATLEPGSPVFSSPLLFNNIFWDNRAGRWDGSAVWGIGLEGDPEPIRLWDLGVAGTSYLLAPAHSVLNVADGTVPSDTNLVGVNPQVVSPYEMSVAIMPWRTDPNFVGVNLVAVDLPPTLMGDYHLQATSPAINAGAASKDGVNAPASDIDTDLRPAGGGYEIGADETGPLSDVPTVLPPGGDVQGQATVIRFPTALRGVTLP